MSASSSTCWTVLQQAAAGHKKDRESFARTYQPLVQAYLAARWRASPLFQDVDDAVQEVFVECLRPRGALAQADPGWPGGFRAFLYGVARNVARRIEKSKKREQGRVSPFGTHVERQQGREDHLSRHFDQEWVKLIVARAVRLQMVRARASGARGVKKVKLLHLRFHEGLPIREIASRWECEPLELHRLYAEARRDFKEALIEVLRFYHPGSRAAAERECKDLLDLLA